VRERVLRAHVDERLLAPRRVRGDSHRLDQPERILLHEDAILERPGLGLVGVADEVVRLRLLARDRLPFGSGWERCAAAAEQRRLLHELDHALRPKLARALERRERRRRLRVEALGDAAKELQPRALWQRRGRRRYLLLAWLRPGDRPQRGGRPLAQPETRRGDRPVGHLGPGKAAGEVVADVEHLHRTLFERQHRVEGRNSVRLGRRHVEAAACVAERARRHPPHAPLRGPQRRKEQMSPRPVAAEDAVPVRRLDPDHRVDRLALVLGRLGVDELQVRQPAPA